ncbi:hypothetical protein BFG52_05530 [Acinetobacter larvae]|uniref:Uncharacterized protein n=1 Tax=Acinetobacter larvae TaxID=1789224 RepID=A0A1B2LY56_9GAMM|nr:hypothetical protein BFG52_05530 [Acinetobacter larvae]
MTSKLIFKSDALFLSRFKQPSYSFYSSAFDFLIHCFYKELKKAKCHSGAFLQHNPAFLMQIDEY